MREAADLARRLAREAEAVCRHYLSQGRREGSYWLVGDVGNTPGRSLFVRLRDSPRGPAGKWTDAATGEHGDLLDLVRLTCGLADFNDVTNEARRFLNLPRPDPERPMTSTLTPVRVRSSSAAHRLFAASRPIAGTLAATYLAGRGIAINGSAVAALRFHPRCYAPPDDQAPAETWPAMIAAVTDLDGNLTGILRTWLDAAGFDQVRLGKAPLSTPRRALGALLGHAVRFGEAEDVLAVGEGVETVLSLRAGARTLPLAAALSAVNLRALRLPPTLRRLYIARDRDPAGLAASQTLADRAAQAGIDPVVLSPRLEDFNTDLRTFGPEGLQATVRRHFAPEDIARFVS